MKRAFSVLQMLHRNLSTISFSTFLLYGLWLFILSPTLVLFYHWTFVIPCSEYCENTDPYYQFLISKQHTLSSEAQVSPRSSAHIRSSSPSSTTSPVPSSAAIMTPSKIASTNGLQPTHVALVSPQRSHTRYARALYAPLDADAAKTQGNAVISAYNIASVFALLAEGASGVALEELASFFGFKGLQNEMLQTTPLRLAERALRATNKKGAHILISNGIFTGDRVRPEYVKRIATLYSGHVEAVDFRKPEKALKKINQQVQEHTKGHIVDLLAEKSITEDTACVLVAVLYFKGTWANPFEARDTLPTNFYVTASDIVSVPMMNKTLPAALFHAPRTLEGGQDVHVSYLVLPFMGDEVRFVVEMRTPDPSSPGVDDIHTLLPMDLDAVLHYARHDARQRVDVAVSLPRFRVESTLNLSPVLQQEGVRQIFRPSPDLSKIVDSMPLFVSSAVHKVVVEINESGAEACAAATMSIVSRSFNANFFVADHPFHFHIVSTVAHTILFSGTVRNPLK